jgi:predicted O-linked N-acetylglucosamine transferase (SPINDLY family)
MAGSPLVDADAFARDVEAAYREMWLNWIRSPE